MNTKQNPVTPSTGKHMKIHPISTQTDVPNGFPRGTTPEDTTVYFPGSVDDRIERELRLKLTHLAHLGKAHQSND